ncbi:MAG: helix-turn-helix transcriptional regulator [Limnohabitans sp.]|jgi:DNA-binding transcriptional ArsR family regulator|nr:helix-turn-helix transcriptional regulator [Limnohabitans sp.]
MPGLKTRSAHTSAPLSGDDEVFDLAAQTFRVMSAPMRLKIISALCEGEKSVTQLLEAVQTTQPNMSQHLASLFRAGVVGKRRDGVLIYYRITNERVVSLCRTLCQHLTQQPPASRTGRRSA